MSERSSEDRGGCSLECCLTWSEADATRAVLASTRRLSLAGTPSSAVPVRGERDLIGTCPTTVAHHCCVRSPADRVASETKGDDQTQYGRSVYARHWRR